MKKFMFALGLLALPTGAFAFSGDFATSGEDNANRMFGHPSAPQYGLSGYNVYLGNGVWGTYAPLPAPAPRYVPPQRECWNLDVC
jgi:hypothetical protein